jgi:hypothetical protein
MRSTKRYCSDCVLPQVGSIVHFMRGIQSGKMEKRQARVLRIGLWWSSVIACAVALISGNGTLAKSSIVVLALFGAVALSLAAWEHGWLRAPVPIGTPIKALLVLFVIWGTMIALGYCVWPNPPASSNHDHASEDQIKKLESLQPTTAQRVFIANLQKAYEDSIVTIRSIKLDDKGSIISFVDDTGFFVNDRGLILTTAENLRLPNEKCRRKFEVVSSDGVVRKAHEVGSTTSPYWRTLKSDLISKALPLSHEPFSSGQTLIILGKSAHSGGIDSRLGKIDHDEDPFFIFTETPAGFNGSPIFDENGKVVAVQIFRPSSGQYKPLMCLKVPTAKFLVGMSAHTK